MILRHQQEERQLRVEALGHGRPLLGAVRRRVHLRRPLVALRDDRPDPALDLHRHVRELLAAHQLEERVHGLHVEVAADGGRLDVARVRVHRLAGQQELQDREVVDHHAARAGGVEAHGGGDRVDAVEDNPAAAARQRVELVLKVREERHLVGLQLRVARLADVRQLLPVGAVEVEVICSSSAAVM